MGNPKAGAGSLREFSQIGFGFPRFVKIRAIRVKPFSLIRVDPWLSFLDHRVQQLSQIT